MQLSDNKYYENIMYRYFIIDIQLSQFEYRQNSIFITQQNDDRSLGVYLAMSDIANLGESVICVNFNSNFPIRQEPNLHFIIDSTIYLSPIPCDYLFVFNPMSNKNNLSKIINYYNPKFIIHC